MKPRRHFHHDVILIQLHVHGRDLPLPERIVQRVLQTFASHDLARKAAERAAKEQAVPGETTGISYEDKDGRWHDEVARGNDRPETDVEG